MCIRDSTCIAALVFVLAAGELNFFTLCLSPVVLLVLFSYSYMKRITRWSVSYTHLLRGRLVAPVVGSGAARKSCQWGRAAADYWSDCGRVKGEGTGNSDVPGIAQTETIRLTTVNEGGAGT